MHPVLVCCPSYMVKVCRLLTSSPNPLVDEDGSYLTRPASGSIPDRSGIWQHRLLGVDP